MNRPHSDNAACHCGPHLFTPCTECAPSYSGTLTSLHAMPSDAGCVFCTHGLRAISATEASRVPQVVVVHQKAKNAVVG